MLFRFCSERRHTAHEHLVEGRIYYRFHPRCGETVLIKRQLHYRGVGLVVILQPDSSLACIPAWMTHEAASQYTLSDKPHFSVDILRSLRAEIDALLGFLQPESEAEGADNVVPTQRSPTKPVRGERGAPVVVLATAQMVDLAALVEALLREIATALANGEVSDEQDQG